MKKQIVISSDDFGMTASVNEGIRLAYENGVLSTTNFMVPCPWFEHALRLSRDMDVTFGIHLTLTCEWRYYKWRALSGNSSIVSDDGYMYTSIEALMTQASDNDIRAECRRQIDLLIRRGVQPCYVDLHMCIPSVSGVLPNAEYEVHLMGLVAEIAKEYALPYAYALEEGKLKYFQSGLSISSKDKHRVYDYLKGLKPGVHHLSCHCAVDTYEQSGIADTQDDNYPWASVYRRADTRLILSSWFAQLIRSENIEILRHYFRSEGSEYKATPALSREEVIDV